MGIIECYKLPVVKLCRIDPGEKSRGVPTLVSTPEGTSELILSYSKVRVIESTTILRASHHPDFQTKENLQLNSRESQGVVYLEELYRRTNELSHLLRRSFYFRCLRITDEYLYYLKVETV